MTPAQTRSPAAEPALTGAAASQTRPRRADARRNRERILLAAAEVFGELGAEAQMDDVARVAGVGVGTLYRHFPTKTALMSDLVRHKMEQFCEHARAALAADDDPLTALSDLLRRNGEELAGDAATRYAMGAGTEVWQAVEEEARLMLVLAGELITRAQRSGQLRRDFTPGDIPMILCAISSSMDRGFDWRRHLQLVLEGLRPASAR